MSETAALTPALELPAIAPAEGEVLSAKRGRGRPEGLVKTGGRAAGIPNLHAKPGASNKELREHVAEVCRARGYDPVSAMCLLGRNRKLDPELRFKIAAEVAPYLYPRVKSIEISGPDGGPMAMAVGVAGLRDWIMSLSE